MEIYNINYRNLFDIFFKKNYIYRNNNILYINFIKVINIFYSID